MVYIMKYYSAIRKKKILPFETTWMEPECILLLLSRWVMFDSLQPHGLQHTRLPCLSSSPRVRSNSHPLSKSCYLTISFSAAPFSFAYDLFQHQGLFQLVGSFHQVAKVLGLQLSPSSEYSGLISFRIEWFDLLTVRVFLLQSTKLEFCGVCPILIWIKAYLLFPIFKKINVQSCLIFLGSALRTNISLGLSMS